MHLILELVFWTMFQGLGRLIKRLFGKPVSASGIAEMWIGMLTCVLLLAAIVSVWRGFLTKVGLRARVEFSG